MEDVQEEKCRLVSDIWKPAQEVTQPLLCRLQFVTQVIILTSNLLIRCHFFLFCMDSCMESPEGKRMIQKYEDMLSLLEK